MLRSAVPLAPTGDPAGQLTLGDHPQVAGHPYVEGPQLTRWVLLAHEAVEASCVGDGPQRVPTDQADLGDVSVGNEFQREFHEAQARQMVASHVCPGDDALNTEHRPCPRARHLTPAESLLHMRGGGKPAASRWLRMTPSGPGTRRIAPAAARPRAA